MAERDSDFGLIINSAICTFNEKRQFVLVTEDYILIYSLPDLMLIGKYPLGNIQNLSKKRLNECYISSKGFFGYWTKTDGWEMCALSANGPEITKPTVFDKYRARKWRLAHGKKSNDTPEAAQLFGQRLESKSPEVPIGIASELANALNERGEKLNEMQVKTGKLADASKTFVDTIKEYNKQQENKKWYQL
ncbi:hypothetical protein BC833DRAFT_565625 [Globomyces pollinis-pini]|nr:hypothetical protein BC833DRAFT_565625 [Globomyces pollinis-pini]